MNGITNISGNTKKNEVLIFNANFFNTHGTFVNSTGSHTVITGCYNGYDGIGFIGRDTSSKNGTGTIRWEYPMDFTPWAYLHFVYCRYAVHGNFRFWIMDNGFSTIITSLTGNYGSYTTGAWNTYTVDLRGITGVHTLVFGGGYSDNTGDASSQSRYSKIIFASSAEILGEYT